MEGEREGGNEGEGRSSIDRTYLGSPLEAWQGYAHLPSSYAAVSTGKTIFSPPSFPPSPLSSPSPPCLPVAASEVDEEEEGREEGVAAAAASPDEREGRLAAAAAAAAAAVGARRLDWYVLTVT